MTPAGTTHRPLRLQTRIMAAVIGIVSLILVVVAAATSTTLGYTLESRLDDQLRASTTNVAQWAGAAFSAEALRPSEEGVTAKRVLAGRSVLPGLLLVVAPFGGEPTGAIVEPTSESSGSIRDLDEDDLRTLAVGLVNQSDATVTLDDYGSYRVTIREGASGTIVVGLPAPRTCARWRRCSPRSLSPHSAGSCFSR
ncbi:hypothetical protein [Microbacterium sp. NIBRBAC000506063]|uniref:hypothetical protein n=1 Tax=Microbacterium sp. NIBRBAC000506063 TaxID=2734618 RepID=UPI001CB6F6AB|nr:hypothetical protein [Microbacterium sp. NIBRBAC000506063]